MKRRITVHDIKQALLDERFRSMLPDELQPDVQKFLKNPGCGCNHSIYLKVLKTARKQIEDYFPTKDAPNDEELQKEEKNVAKNEWQVINCNIHELESELKKLKVGRKQMDIARFQNEITIVVNHLE